MEKRNIILGVVVALFVIGAVFVTAGLGNNEEKQGIEELESLEECGPNNCGGECGGNCGIPTCGCSR